MARARTLILTAAMLALLAAGSARAALQAGWLRNEAHAALAGAAAQPGPPCAAEAGREAAPRLLRAADLEPASASNWRTLLRLQGRVDRAWVARQAGAAPPQVFQPPPAWNLHEPWNAYRCGAAWDAWTVGLMEGARGNWAAAVAYYQAGLGLAPGRVPPGILQEFYLALGRYQLSGFVPTAAGQLRAAKYLALAGEAEEARPLFASAMQNLELGAAQRCEAALGLAWLEQGAGAGVVPPWPAALPAGGACDAALAGALLPAGDAVPEWQFDSSDAPVPQLLGLDLDRDVLDAGAEIVGYLYWQTADGGVTRQRVRLPSLWPNSGNAWLPLEGFWDCLPGYTEPSRIEVCQSSTVPVLGADGEFAPAGRLHNASTLGPPVPADSETLLGTTQFSLPLDSVIVFGGRWLVAGDFPGPHIALIGGEDEYRVLHDLGGAAPGGWAQGVDSAVAGRSAGDYSLLLRSYVAQDEGYLEFDDFFLFVLPAQGPG